ncbi:ARM repeat-containing protein [Corynespora cassiicola Philippines]|uniref:ARM repeat-containing protein n=1 Tax=Corynespora cassiicola Philippines TaxID=1448308 RepID=A0A2T2NST3_CORCC|nr:ARM repeat-containing protein [Corynespora cassiicola Philippines]
MGRSTIPPALQELAHPTTPEAQVGALRSLKNEIVGHEQRKELAVLHGVVRPLAGILKAEARKGGKRRRGVMNGSGNSTAGATAAAAAATAGREGEGKEEWGVEDELRFQATLVVGTLANGGPAFVTPLLAGGVFPPLLEALSPGEAPSKLVVSTLRTLNQIVDAIAQERPWSDWVEDPSPSSLAVSVGQQIYSKPVVESLAEIIAQAPRSSVVREQISWAIKLIVKSCREDQQRKMLLDAGILDLLATKLTAIASADDLSRRPDSKGFNKDELPRTYLADILEAIAIIIKDSHFNTARFLYSQPTRSLFGWPKSGTSTEGYSGSSPSTSWDRLIPRLQTMQSKNDNSYTKSWPALGAYSGTGSDSYTRLPSVDTLQPSRNVIADESENPLLVWLIYVARRGEGRERLASCWLLALLKKFGERWPLNDPSKTTRERHFSYLIIPLVVKMIEEANPAGDLSRKYNTPNAQAEHKSVLERSPLVLAELVAGNKSLQNAAVDAKILPVLVQILKKSFEPITTSSKPLWQPKSASSQVRDPMVDPVSSTLGRPGLSPEVLHAFKYRESVLLALAAIADSQDSLRKQVIEIGAATHIIDSLAPFPEASGPSSTTAQNIISASAKDGNPEPVLIAACKVTRSLSRSISVLRTSLIDHGIAQPSFDLLTHPNVKVQIAATSTITNLVLEVSPMRTEIIEAGALKTLCEHCRSANFELRYGSLWALKHLCLGLPYAMKVHCLEELGVGWLVQTLNGEPSRTSATPLGMGTPNAAGEQVDILNAVDDPHMDVDDEPSSEEDENTMTDSIPAMRRNPRPHSRYTSAANIRDRLQQIKNDEQDVRLNSERDDIRLQEQALDFIRNFITEDKASGDMIDHLLKAFGHSRFFELLDARIRPKNSSSAGAPTTTPSSTTYWGNPAPPPRPFSTSSPATSLPQNTNWSAYPATELIIGTLYILVHLANGRPAHRSLLISQTQLMTHVLPLLSHPRREVRLPCAWFINNLVWVEEAADEPATRERAQQLRDLGFEEGARLLGRDMDLDIRERAKTAIEQMGKLLGTAGTGYASPAQAGGFGEGGLGRLGGLQHLGHQHGRQGGWGHRGDL